MRWTITSFWVCPTPAQTDRQTDRQTAEERSVNLRKRDTDAEHSFFLLTDFRYNLSAWQRAVRDLLAKHKSCPRLALGGLCFWLRHILTTTFYSSLVIESVYRREWDTLSICDWVSDSEASVNVHVMSSKARQEVQCVVNSSAYLHTFITNIKLVWMYVLCTDAVIRKVNGLSVRMGTAHLQGFFGVLRWFVVNWITW